VVPSGFVFFFFFFFSKIQSTQIIEPLNSLRTKKGVRSLKIKSNLSHNGLNSDHVTY